IRIAKTFGGPGWVPKSYTKPKDPVQRRKSAAKRWTRKKRSKAKSADGAYGAGPSVELPENVLELPTAMFCCHQCNRAYHYPAILMHSCYYTRLKSHMPYHEKVKRGSGLADVVVSGDKPMDVAIRDVCKGHPWNANIWFSFDGYRLPQLTFDD